ncbi:hypothetical protein CVT26_014543 [Gymnopilus dilepis]|uniref:F-box domain-containing protein n=1 Tax=Gymnopilus dilepis TaxID=231916 RepID=A0A409W324_9AGAR|nr:hypothetical protein CVT26_014543 [Gymnopilus dilepis]
MSFCVRCEQTLGPADRRAEVLPLCQSSPADYCTVCQELVTVNDEIERVKAMLHGLFDKQDEIRSRLNITHPSIVDRLPVEVAAHIFITYATDCQYRRTSALLRLGAISRRWRQIAWSTPGIWSEISFYFPRQRIPQERLELIEEWLARTSGYPLTIKLMEHNLSDSSPYLEEFFALIDILNQYCKQWSRLFISLPPSLLLSFDCSSCISCDIHYLGIHTNGTQAVALPPVFSRVGPKKLRSRGPLSLDMMSLNWSRVTEIDITYITVDQGLRILRLSPNLRHCLFEEISVSDVATPVEAYRHINHPVLQRVRVGMVTEDAMALFLQNITLPALEEFRIRDWASHPGPANMLRSLFIRSSNKLKSLKLDKVNITGDELISVTQVTPSLEKLCLRPRRDAGERGLDSFYQALKGHLSTDDSPSSTHQAPLLPSLRFFHWKVEAIFPWEFISAFLVPLSREGHGIRRPLETIEIVCKNFFGDRETCISQSVRSELAPFEDLVKFQFKLREDSGDQFDLWHMTDESFCGSLGSYGSTRDGEL